MLSTFVKIKKKIILLLESVPYYKSFWSCGVKLAFPENVIEINSFVEFKQVIHLTIRSNKSRKSLKSPKLEFITFFITQIILQKHRLYKFYFNANYLFFICLVIYIYSKEYFEGYYIIVIGL